ncbi:MAG: hypothetical protein WC906_00315 [Parcubacteria group bacterium]
MPTKKLLKLNIYIFLFYFLAYFVSSKVDLGLFSSFRIVTGLTVFFVAGINMALVLEKISRFYLDLWELLTVGIFASLFFMPPIVFVFYSISGFISEISIILLYLVTSTVSLLFVCILEKNGSNKKS